MKKLRQHLPAGPRQWVTTIGAVLAIIAGPIETWRSESGHGHDNGRLEALERKVDAMDGVQDDMGRQLAVLTNRVEYLEERVGRR